MDFLLNQKSTWQSCSSRTPVIVSLNFKYCNFTNSNTFSLLKLTIVADSQDVLKKTKFDGRYLSRRKEKKCVVPQLLHNIKFVFFPTHFFPSMKKKNNFLSFFVECLGYIQENCSVIGPTHLVFLDGIKNICWISFAIFCCNMYNLWMKPDFSTWHLRCQAQDLGDKLPWCLCLMSSKSDIKFMNFTPLGLTSSKTRWVGHCVIIT